MKITSNQNHANLFFWVGAYFIFLLLILLPIFSTSGGMVYPLDDVYIHLTMAKNLLQNGTWGLFPNENIAASSSPLYTLILSPFTFNASIAILAPLLLNILVSIVILMQFHQIVQKSTISPIFRYLLGIVFLLIIPLPSLTVMGMEHLLHCLFVVLICNNILTESLRKWMLPLLVALSIFLRLETAFVICGVLLWSLLERKWNIFNQVFIGSFLGFCLYFLLSVIFSVSIIPNTILLKTIITNDSFLQSTISKIWNSKLLLMISIVSLGTLIIRWKQSKLFLIVFIASFLQLVLARQGWFYRYEAFVVTLFFIVFIIEYCTIVEKKKKIIFLIIACLFLLICSKRAFLSMTTTHLASKNIYDQQIQMAMIVKTLPETSNIAVNDIGAVSYYNNNKILDLYGIASKEVFQLKQNKSFTSQNLRNLLKEENIDIAMVYTSWFDTSIFNEFKPISMLQLQNNVVCGDTLVTIFQENSSRKFLNVFLP
jgi:hypothetical protein